MNYVYLFVNGRVMVRSANPTQQFTGLVVPLVVRD